MIIACPACATRYVVPDTAIGIEGRTVRCAKCRNSWFQDGPEIAASPTPVSFERGAAIDDGSPTPQARTDFSSPPAPAPSAPLPPAPPSSSPAVSVSYLEERAGPVSGQPAPDPTPMRDTPEQADEEAVDPVQGTVSEPPIPPVPLGGVPASEWAEAKPHEVDPVEDEDFSQFDREPPFRPRRNWLRWLTWGAGVFAALALAAVAAMSTLGLPSWVPIEKPLFGADPGLKVEFPASEQERRTLPNGAEFFGARVIISNPTRESKSVPPLLIVLRDSRERVVYSWELAPPQRTLAPGEAMTINEAMTDVPRSAVYADIGWAPR